MAFFSFTFFKNCFCTNISGTVSKGLKVNDINARCFQITKYNAFLSHNNFSRINKTTHLSRVIEGCFSLGFPEAQFQPWFLRFVRLENFSTNLRFDSTIHFEFLWPSAPKFESEINKNGYGQVSWRRGEICEANC